jgi:hypothetical protein
MGPKRAGWAALVRHLEGMEGRTAMTLAKRLAKLEQTRCREPEQELDLPPDLRERIEAAYAAGHGLEALSMDDLTAIVDAPMIERGAK